MPYFCFRIMFPIMPVSNDDWVWWPPDASHMPQMHSGVTAYKAVAVTLNEIW